MIYQVQYFKQGHWHNGARYECSPRQLTHMLDFLQGKTVHLGMKLTPGCPIRIRQHEGYADNVTEFKAA